MIIISVNYNKSNSKKAFLINIATILYGTCLLFVNTIFPTKSQHGKQI